MTIAEFIKSDVISRLSAGQWSDSSLTLDKLSKQYQVSPTPVRVAVKELIHEGYLRKQHNRRLAICRDRIANIAIQPTPEPPKDWYKIIFEDLIQLSLQGKPVLLREESTAAKYGISRTSIQKIFNRLAGDGVLEHLPRRGWQLRPFRQTDLDAYLEARAPLELKALDLAWSSLDDADLQAMLDANRVPESPDEMPKYDNSLHGYLIEKAKNPYIADFFQRHGRYYDVLFTWEAMDREARTQTVQQHRDILEALLRRDRTAAKRALVNHIQNNHPVLEKIIQDKSGQSSAGAPVES